MLEDKMDLGEILKKARISILIPFSLSILMNCASLNHNIPREEDSPATVENQEINSLNLLRQITLICLTEDYALIELDEDDDGIGDLLGHYYKIKDSDQKRDIYYLKLIGYFKDKNKNGIFEKDEYFFRQSRSDKFNRLPLLLKTSIAYLDNLQ